MNPHARTTASSRPLLNNWEQMAQSATARVAPRLSRQPYSRWHRLQRAPHGAAGRARPSASPNIIYSIQDATGSQILACSEYRSRPRRGQAAGESYIRFPRSSPFAFNTGPSSNRVTVCADTLATFASFRLLHPRARHPTLNRENGSHDARPHFSPEILHERLTRCDGFVSIA